MRRVLQRIVTRHTFASGAMLVGYCAPRGLLKYWEGELKLARNNALADQADIVAISKTDPVESLQAAAVRINTELKQQGNPTLSGDALWNAVAKDVIKSRISNIEQEAAALKKIAADAKANATCFVAGTLVHTKEGLRPIEQIKVGDWVLSQPEGKGDLSYKQVTRTFVHEDEDFIWLIKFNYAIEDVEKIHLAVAVNEINGEKLYIGRDWIAVTENHPFFAKDKGWIRAGDLLDGEMVELANGNHARVSYCAKIFQTKTPNVGWAPVDERGGGRPSWGCQVEFAADGIKAEHESGPSDTYERPMLTRTVYNFEVQDNHTYYVGELGVWVHNTNCTGGEAITDGFKKPAYETACFCGDTEVQTKWGPTEIQHIRPGIEVLSRCEKTGEMGWRKVVECFVHEKTPTLYLFYTNKDGTTGLPIITTAEHPFWVKGRGWTAVRDLQPGDIIETCDGAKYALKSKWAMPVEQTEIYEGATVTVKSVSDLGKSYTVYNLNVEEFHTYFVGFDGLWVHNL